MYLHGVSLGPMIVSTALATHLLINLVYIYKGEVLYTVLIYLADILDTT